MSKERVKNILERLNERNAKYLIHVMERGRQLGDIQFIFYNNPDREIYSIDWYKTVEDRRRDVLKSGWFLSEREFKEKVDYYEYYVDKYTIREALEDLGYVVLPNKELEKEGDAVVSEWGGLDEFNKWIDGKEEGRDYDIYYSDREYLSLSELSLKIRGVTYNEEDGKLEEV